MILTSHLRSETCLTRKEASEPSSAGKGGDSAAPRPQAMREAGARSVRGRSFETVAAFLFRYSRAWRYSDHIESEEQVITAGPDLVPPTGSWTFDLLPFTLTFTFSAFWSVLRRGQSWPELLKMLLVAWEFSRTGDNASCHRCLKIEASQQEAAG